MPKLQPALASVFDLGIDQLPLGIAQRFDLDPLRANAAAFDRFLVEDNIEFQPEILGPVDDRVSIPLAPELPKANIKTVEFFNLARQGDEPNMIHRN